MDAPASRENDLPFRHLVLVPCTKNDTLLLMVDEGPAPAPIAAVGPVIAPSANKQGEPPFRTIDAARQQFGEAVDYYCDGGVVPEVVQPSRIIRVTNVNKGNSHDDSDSRGSTNAGSSGNVAIEIIRP